MPRSDTLDFELCQKRAVECYAMAADPSILPAVGVMLTHIAETWRRIADRLDEADSGVAASPLP